MKIPYIKKSTTAKTEYRKITSFDLNRIFEQASKLVSVGNSCNQFGIKEGMILCTPNPKMPRLSTGGRNTPVTMCEGIIDNFNKGQYDLSSKQCDGLIEAFRIGSDVIENFETVEFEEVLSLPKIPSPEVAPMVSTFGDLFDTMKFEVTVRMVK